MSRSLQRVQLLRNLRPSGRFKNVKSVRTKKQSSILSILDRLIECFRSGGDGGGFMVQIFGANDRFTLWTMVNANGIPHLQAWTWAVRKVCWVQESFRSMSRPRRICIHIFLQENRLAAYSIVLLQTSSNNEEAQG